MKHLIILTCLICSMSAYAKTKKPDPKRVKPNTHKIYHFPEECDPWDLNSVTIYYEYLLLRADGKIYTHWKDGFLVTMYCGNHLTYFEAYPKKEKECIILSIAR